MEINSELIEDLGIKNIVNICKKCLNHLSDECFIDEFENNNCMFDGEYDLIITDILERLFIKGRIELYKKYSKFFNHFIDLEIFELSLDPSLDPNYFCEALTYMKEKDINICKSHIFSTMTIDQIQIYINLGYDINVEYNSSSYDTKKDTTLLIDCISNILRQSYCGNIYIEKFKFLINNGANIKAGNLFRQISGIQYEDREKRVNFIEYLIDEMALDTININVFKEKMLYDTRLGKCIINIVSSKIKTLFHNFDDKYDIFREINHILTDYYIIFILYSEYGYKIIFHNFEGVKLLTLFFDLFINNFTSFYNESSQGLREVIYSNRTEYFVNGNYYGNTMDDRIADIQKEFGQSILLNIPQLLLLLNRNMNENDSIDVVSFNEYVGIQKLIGMIKLGI